MSTRLEVQSAILHGRGSANEQLPENEIRDPAKWLEEYLHEKYDRQIESDVRTLRSILVLERIVIGFDGNRSLSNKHHHGYLVLVIIFLLHSLQM